MPAQRQTGFTLMELVVVLVVMGVLAAVSAPQLLRSQSESEMAVRDDVKTMLRYTRGLATSQRRYVCTKFTATQVSALYGAALPPKCAGLPLVEPGSGQAYVVNLPGNVTIAPLGAVVFDPTGKVSPYPAVDPTVTVGSQPALTVSRETGFVD